MGKAVFLHGRNDARVSPFNLREGAPDEVLIDVGAVGICGSDMHYYKDGGIGSAIIKAPFVPGHEFGGYPCEGSAGCGLGRGAPEVADNIKGCHNCHEGHEEHVKPCQNME